MSEQNQLIRMVAHLNELTQENKLQWQSVYEPSSSIYLGRDKIIGAVFESEFSGKHLRIYEEQSKYWHDEESYSWSPRLVFAFVDINGNNEWESPNVPGLYDLFESVRYQSAGVNEFLNNMFTPNE